jgi:hypothetical protein
MLSLENKPDRQIVTEPEGMIAREDEKKNRYVVDTFDLSSQKISSALPLFLLAHRRRSKEVSAIGHALASTARRRNRHGRHRAVRLNEAFLAALDRNAHVASVSSLAAVALVFADAAFNADSGVLAAAAGALAIATFLALAASLAARLGGEVFFVGAKGVLEVDGGGCRGLA